MTASPCADELGDLALDVGLGADVDAARRLVEDEQLRGSGQPAREHDLLLVAAGQVAGRAASGRRAGRRARSCTRTTTASCSALRILRSQPRRAWMPRTMFSATVRSATMPSARRSSEENAIRGRSRAAGMSILTRLAVDLELSGVGAIGAVEQADELGAARAQQARDARRPRRRTPRGPPARATPRRPMPVARRTGAGSVDARARRSRRSPPARRARGRSSSSTSSPRGRSSTRYSPTSRPLRSTVMRSEIS